MLPRRVQFDTFGSEAHCECGEKFIVADDGRFDVSPHLREKHGFGDRIAFCPPRETVVAYEAASVTRIPEDHHRLSAELERR